VQADRQLLFEHDTSLLFSVTQVKEVLRPIFPLSGLTTSYCKLSESDVHIQVDRSFLLHKTQGKEQ